ncbi:MAG: pyridoxal-phosphate dependent enzyme [Alphaproteobacteria bacterium]|nr:pyridoxal-phosphate dependent enzyme [Alphaproteobacteria bacterium]
MKKVYNAVEEMSKHTPMYHFAELGRKLGLEGDIFGKCEFLNPLGAGRLRVMAAMLDATAPKAKENDAVIIEAGDGNSGLALAAMCASHGLKGLAIMPEGENAAKAELIKYLGCDVILTPQGEGMHGALAKAEMLAQKSSRAIWLKRFANPANVETHLLETSVEIMDDMGGDVDVVAAIAETGGTLCGIAQALKTANAELKVVAVRPETAGSGDDKMPQPLLEAKLIDEWVDITDDDAWAMAKLTAQTEGVLLGKRSGAVMAAAVAIAKDKKVNIVTVLDDINPLV